MLARLLMPWHYCEGILSSPGRARKNMKVFLTSPCLIFKFPRNSFTVNALSSGPWSLCDKNWEGLTGCPCLSMLNYSKNQCRSDKTVILNALTAVIQLDNIAKVVVDWLVACYLVLDTVWTLQRWETWKIFTWLNIIAEQDQGSKSV